MPHSLGFPSRHIVRKKTSVDALQFRARDDQRVTVAGTFQCQQDLHRPKCPCPRCIQLLASNRVRQTRRRMFDQVPGRKPPGRGLVSLIEPDTVGPEPFPVRSQGRIRERRQGYGQMLRRGECECEKFRSARMPAGGLVSRQDRIMKKKPIALTSLDRSQSLQGPAPISRAQMAVNAVRAWVSRIVALVGDRLRKLVPQRTYEGRRRCSQDASCGPAAV